MLKKQIVISFLSVLVIGFTGLLAIPFLTRLLSPQDMGKLFLILAVVSIMQIFDGLKPVITFTLNEKKYPEHIYLQVFRKINHIFILGSSLIIFSVLIFIPTISWKEIALFILTFVFYSLMSVQWGILDTKNQINFTSIFRSIGWVLTYSLFVLFAYSQIPMEYYILPLMIMYIFLFISFKFKVSSLKPIDMTFQTKESTKVLYDTTFHKALDNIKIQTSAIVLLSMDKILTPLILGYQQFAFYAVQSELATKSYLVNTTLRRVLFPYFAKTENKHKLSDYLKYVNFVFIISLLLVLCIGLYGKEIIGLYAGVSYEEYGAIFSVLLLVFPANILGTYGVVVLHANGDFTLHHRLYRNAAILSLPIFTALTYIYGINGAAMGLLISRIVDIYVYYKAIDKFLKKLNFFNICILSLLYISLGVAIFFQKHFLIFTIYLFLSLILFNNKEVNK